MIIRVIIPAHNEQDSIPMVLQDIPKIVSEVIVVCNACTDRTFEAAQTHGATALKEERKGYGFACLKGMDHISTSKTDIVVFIDGDYSDHPEELTKLIAPIIDEGYDFVVGSRNNKNRQSGSMTKPQVFGNWLATTLMKVFFKSTFTDLGPFRAIKHSELVAMNMGDKTYGWTVEMQLKALKRKLRYKEVPVLYRKRIGVSKVSGTVKGTIMAGVKIIGWIVKYSFKK